MLTVALALGVERMARHRADVRRLSAVEALGSVTVIATDKTGTLTRNRMDLRAIDAPDPARALEAIALANDAWLVSEMWARALWGTRPEPLTAVRRHPGCHECVAYRSTVILGGRR